ncbi:MAG: type II toxin-antitoxin system VapC family toxin [Archaeoglobaceae archaeon]|uniref:PIN domain-containing protein n=1 Tax=Archaeoglobus fulgidus TaxID=2234 RepID=A0A7J3M197_ARCFL
MDNCIQHLTIYEVLNAIWKEARIFGMNLEETKRFAEIFSEIVKRMKVLEIKNLESVLSIAVKTGLSFYDSSYIALAAELNLELVTEDGKLREKASNIVRVSSLEEVLNR